MNNKSHIYKILIFFLLLFLLALSINIQAADNNDGEYYYGYGDSIMRAEGHCGLGFDDCFVIVMKDTYDAGHTADNCEDGGGRTSNWGLTNFPTYFDSDNEYFIYMFGANDLSTSVPSNIMASNMLKIYNLTAENSTNPVVCILTLLNAAAYPAFNIADMVNMAKTLENECKKYSIPFVKLYDAIDSDTWNGEIDSWAAGYYCDNVHPTGAGHDAMADFLWYFINGSDYKENYYATNDTITINADYNQTIYVNMKSGWDYGNITIYCITNGTYIGWNVGYGNTIHFDVVKGSKYELRGSSSSGLIDIISFSGKANVSSSGLLYTISFGGKAEIKKTEKLLYTISFGGKAEIKKTEKLLYTISFGGKAEIEKTEKLLYTISFGSKAEILSPHNITVRTNSTGYFCFRGSNTTAANFSSSITGFDEVKEYISVWKGTSWSTSDWMWINYYGDGSGTDFELNRFDVVRIYLDDGDNNIVISMIDSQNIKDCTGRSVYLSYPSSKGSSHNRGYNYTCFCVNCSECGYTTLKAVAIQSPLTTGESIAYWNNDTYKWKIWIVGVTPDSMNCNIHSFCVFETKVTTDETWIIP